MGSQEGSGTLKSLIRFSVMCLVVFENSQDDLKSWVVVLRRLVEDKRIRNLLAFDEFGKGSHPLADSSRFEYRVSERTGLDKPV